jgi:hypothetical protein
LTGATVLDAHGNTHAAEFARMFDRQEDGAVRPADIPDCTVVMVRGLFGSWIPGHFRAPIELLRARGWHATVARTDPAGTLERNRRLLLVQVAALVEAGQRPVFLAHSKGGLETLLALAAEPRLAAATLGFAGVQVPRAGAPFLESLFHRRHHDSRTPAERLVEPLQAAALTLAGARAACRELEDAALAPSVSRVDGATFPFPVLMAASVERQVVNARAQQVREPVGAGVERRVARLFAGARHDEGGSVGVRAGVLASVQGTVSSLSFGSTIACVPGRARPARRGPEPVSDRAAGRLRMRTTGRCTRRRPTARSGRARSRRQAPARSPRLRSSAGPRR